MLQAHFGQPARIRLGLFHINQTTRE
jgi:hypothetical protein